MTTESEIQPAREHLKAHIQKTVGISALRKIRGLVDQHDEEDRHARRSTPIGIALLCLAAFVVLMLAFAFRFVPSERVAAVPTAAPPERAARPLRVEHGAQAEDPALTRYGVIWGPHVEKIGANDLPQAIRDKALYGSTTLTTHVRTEDGAVERVEVIRSSGHPQLDDAAQKLVMRASPFPPPPDALKKQARTIKITREFRFTKD